MKAPQICDVKVMSVKALHPAPYNPREISREALAGLTASLRRFGLVEPVIWNRRTKRVIGGHQRLAALRELKVAKVQAVVVDLPEVEEKALNLALNNPAIQGQFTAGVKDLLAEIQVDAPDLASELLLGEIEVPAVSEVTGGGKIEPDEVPEPPAKQISQPGDLWILGDHRLLCGDATDRDQVAAVLGGVPADMVFTDPPYNMAYKSKALGGLMNDSIGEAEFVRLILASCGQMLEALRPGGSWYICMSSAGAATVYHQLRKLGMPCRTIVWVKPCPGLGSQDYRPAHEVILYGTKPPRKSQTWNAGRSEGDVWEFEAGRNVVARKDGQGMVLEFYTGVETVVVTLEKASPGNVITFDGQVSDVWRFSREKAGYVHPTQKPVDLVIRAIHNSSSEGSTVLEPFSGSGTTIIACEQTRRRCCAMDLDPKYVDVAVRRWEAFTGRKAKFEKRAGQA